MNEVFQPTHIDYARVAATHPPIYMIHKYWARKPHNVVREYIEHYSRPDEVVFDPFCGSGVTAIEAARVGRRTIALDLSPLSELILKSTLIPVDLDELDGAFGKIEKDIRAVIQGLYRNKCPKCGANAIARYIVWSHVVNCPVCRKRIIMAYAKSLSEKSGCVVCDPCAC